jgi:hypothetical protein
MNLRLSFYLVTAVAGALACSDDGKGTRDNTSTGGTAGQASTGNSGAGGGSSGGAGGQGTSGAGGGGSGVNLGAALTITAAGSNDLGSNGSVVDSAGSTGLNGIAQVIKSPLGTMVTSGIKDGGLCMAGTTVVVPNMDYTNYWGAEIDLDVKLSENPNAGATADAGADAGGDAGGAEAPAQVPIGWNASAANVVGFSFKIEGPTVPVAFRFKALPFGADPSAVTYCYQVAAAPTGATVVNVRFDQITFECWNPNGVAALTMPYPPDNPDGKLLRTISWQVPADIAVPFPFDFCVSDIKPILGN